MTVRLSTLVLLALVTLALGLASSDEVNKYELDEDSTTKDNFDISFVVNRKFAKPDEDVEYEEDDEDYEDEEDQSGEFEEDLTPEERESLKKEPYRRLSNWNQRGGWPQHPLYVIILGG